MHAVLAMVTTAVQSMSAFEHTDSAFRADAPPLTPTEPALAFVRAPREGLRAPARQDDSANAANGRRLFIGRGAEPAIAGGKVRRAAEDRLMPIQRRRPQGDVGRSPRMHFTLRRGLRESFPGRLSLRRRYPGPLRLRSALLRRSRPWLRSETLRG